MRTAGVHDVRCQHLGTVGRRDAPSRRALLDGLDQDGTRGLADASAVALDRSCQTQDELQWVEPEARRVQHAIRHKVGLEHVAHSRRRHERQLGAEQLVHVLHLVLQLASALVGREACDAQVAAVIGVAFDAVRANALTQQPLRLERLAHERRRGLGSDLVDQLVGLEHEARDRHAAIHARAAPSESIGLEHDARAAALADAQRRSEAGEAAANHAHVDLHLLAGCQRRPRRRLFGQRGSVVRRG